MLPPHGSSGCHTEFWFFRTFRALRTVWQNFFVRDWLTKRPKKSLSIPIVQLSTESADEPTIGMASVKKVHLDFTMERFHRVSLG